MCLLPPFFSLRLRLRRKCDDEDVCLLAIFLPLFCGECGCGVEEKEEEEEEEGVRGPFLCGEIVAFVTMPLLGNVQIMKDTYAALWLPVTYFFCSTYTGIDSGVQQHSTLIRIL